MKEIALGRLMGAIHKNVEAQFTSRLSDIDFDFNFNSNYSYFQYLAIICNSEGINQNELALRMNVGKGSASKAVKYLLNNKLIYRVQDEKDNRIKNVFPTEKGKHIADRFKIVFMEMNLKLVEDFTQSEVDLFRSMLKRAYKNTAINENNFIMNSFNFLDE